MGAGGGQRSHLRVGLLQLGAERDRRVVRAEDLGREAVHDLLEIVVEHRWGDLVEELVGRLLLLHELLDQLPHLRRHLRGVVVLDRVLPEEVEV
jgi:hypothetical protein